MYYFILLGFSRVFLPFQQCQGFLACIVVRLLQLASGSCPQSLDHTFPQRSPMQRHKIFIQSTLNGGPIFTRLTCTNWTVRADLPTPPLPSTTILYSRILFEILTAVWCGRFWPPHNRFTQIKVSTDNKKNVCFARNASALNAQQEINSSAT